MTLSARIPIGPSRRLALLSVAIPSAGVLVAASTMAARWPQSSWLLAVTAMVVCATFTVAMLARHRRAIVHTLIVSQHAEFDVQPDPLGTEGTWRLAESTVVWPGFSMLALRKSDSSIATHVTRLGVFDAELVSGNRRSLSRFLLWSLRGGDSRPFGNPGRP